MVTVQLYNSPTNIFEPISNTGQRTSYLSGRISDVTLLWFLAADTNNSRITLATETNRRTAEASSVLYKNKDKEEINRQFLVLHNCRRYPYVHYHTAGCVLCIIIFTVGMVHLYIMVLAGSSL
jgi:hypothetical protein